MSHAITSAGQSQYLGSFSTAVEAAVAIAKFEAQTEAPQADASAAAGQLVTEVEGYKLERSSKNATGYATVSFVDKVANKFEARLSSAWFRWA